MFAVSKRGYFANIISPSHLFHYLTSLYCLLNDWNHRHHSRLKYSKSYEKYSDNASRPKYIVISKFSLVL